MAHEQDGLVGRIALQKGVITEDQLKDCLAHQAALQKAGQKRALGVIMVSRGLLQDADILDLLEDQKRQAAERANYADVRREDFQSGQALLKRGILTTEQLNAALRRQEEAAGRGLLPLPRLGQILIEMGIQDAKVIQETLRIQYKTIYDCPGCALKYNLLNARSDRKYRCRKCGELLVPKPTEISTPADQSAPGRTLEVNEDVPAEVAEAERDPANLFGKYVLIREIGRGAMGTVHKAYQKDLKRTLAVKILRGDDPETLERFYHEAQLAARLKHPGIVSVYEIGKHLEIPYLAMEHIEGRPLDEMGKLPVRKACAILRDVALAVHYAHEKGIIHRDLKPANIIIDREGHPYVTDFGLARKVTGDRNLTLKGLIVGTPAYMSPEQAQGNRNLTPQSDVASLGNVLYELLTGTQPYTGKTPVDVALAVINDDPARPSRQNPGIPHELESICLKAMAKDRDRRYSTARAFAQDLNRFLEGEPVLARQPSLATILRSRMGKNKLAVGIAAGAVMALTAALVMMIHLSAKTRRMEALLRARTLEGGGREEEALRVYEKAGAPAEAERVREDLRRQEEERLQAGEERRRQAEREAIRRQATELVRKAREAGQLSERVSLASQAIDTDPDLEEAYTVRAGAYDQLGFSDAALKDLGRAAELSGNPVPHLIRQADIARRLGRVEDEIRLLDEAIRIDDRSADLFHRRGTARFVSRDYAGAVADWETAVRLDESLRKALEPRLNQARRSLKP